jgi:hypothetical protein
MFVSHSGLRLTSRRISWVEDDGLRKTKVNTPPLYRDIGISTNAIQRRAWRHMARVDVAKGVNFVNLLLQKPLFSLQSDAQPVSANQLNASDCPISP